MTEHITIGDIRPRIQYTADGAVRDFTFPFPIFDDGDLLVYLGTALQVAGYAVSGAGESAGGTVTFSAAPAAGSIVTLTRRVPEERTSDFQEGGAFRAAVINEELDRIVCMVQQLRDELGRSVARPVTSASTASLSLPDPVAGKALKWSDAGDGLENSEVDPDVLGNAAATAATAATAAAVSQGAAAASALAAANDAASAAASARAIGSREVVRIHADYTATAADNGRQLLVICSDADITVTLPPGSATGEPWEILGGKGDDTAHTADFVTSGGDTMTGGNVDGADTTYRLSGKGAGVLLRVDVDTEPDDWLATSMGAAAGDATPVGAYMGFPVDTPPTGYLIRNGAAVSRIAYADLFAVIGTTFGAGDGSSTFNLPNDIAFAVPTEQKCPIRCNVAADGLLKTGSVGVASVAHLGTGKYRVTFSEAFDTTYYTCEATAYSLPGTAYCHAMIVAKATTYVDIDTFYATAGWYDAGFELVVFYGEAVSASTDELPCIKAFNGVTNQAMLELGDLAADVVEHGTRIAALETCESFPGVQADQVRDETNFPIGTTLLAKITSVYVDRNQAAAVYVSTARADLYTLAPGGAQLAGTWVARGTDQSYATQMMQRVA